jgi:hypothetical protein
VLRRTLKVRQLAENVEDQLSLATNGVNLLPLHRTAGMRDEMD